MLWEELFHETQSGRIGTVTEGVCMERVGTNVLLMRQSKNDFILPSKSAASWLRGHSSTHRLLGWLQAEGHS